MIDVQQFCEGVRDVRLDGDEIVVTLGRGRQHRITIEQGDVVELIGVVARKAVVDKIEGIALSAWRRNRATSIVGFRLDNRGRLVGEAWVPGAGLTKEEFLFYARSLAAACDLFEFQLTGRDRE